VGRILVQREYSCGLYSLSTVGILARSFSRLFLISYRTYWFSIESWSKRTLLDDFTRLWSSWVVLGKHKRIFFSGDTGYCSVFKTIGNRFGPFDASLIAIGAYCPRWFMKPQHIDPDEAVQIHQDLHSKFSLGIHWGTFLLTMEPETEPPELLKASLEKRGLPSSIFVTISIGETRSIKDAMSHVSNL